MKRRTYGPLHFAVYVSLLSAFALLALAAGRAEAQNSIEFDLNVAADSTLTWSTSPAADACQASGDWSGEKAASGSESVGRISSSSVFVLACSWAGDSLATVSWVEPTENTDGTPYENPDVTRLAWAEGAGSVAAFDCMDPAATPDIATADRPAGETMHTVTGLTPGTWEFVAYAVNDIGICSAASNTASKETTAGTDTQSTISVTVPAPISGLTAE